MRTVQRGTRAGVMVTLLLFAAPSPSAVANAAASRWAEMRADAFSKLDTVRGLVGTGRIADAVRAAAGLVDVAPASISPGAPRDIAFLAGLAEPVARLLAAVQGSGAAAQAAVRTDPARLASLQRRADALGESDLAEARRLLEQLDRALDRPLLYGAALSLASSIDRALPALAAIPSPASTGQAVGCDVYENHPVLCIGGTGSNAYEKDYALLIDQGGDDTYTNAAGGADPVGGNGLPVSVVIDRGGNDQYVTPVPTATGARAVQGASNVGSIGILVDQEGNDTYEATATGTTVAAQGRGGGGVGVLADLAGDDTYRLLNESPASTDGQSEGAQGQANATLGGLGLLLDRSGDDSFLARTNPVPSVDAAGTLHPGESAIQAVGYANIGGAAILSVGDGTDSVALESITGPVAADETRPVAVETPIAWGMGYGNVGGAGVLLGGDGPTSWTTTVSLTTPASFPFNVTGGIAAQYLGHGKAQLEGLGAIVDAGGSDRYLADVAGTVRHRVTVDDSCACGRAVFKANGGQASAFAMARASGGGVGAIRDLAGADRYTTRVTSLAEIEVRDERTVPPQPDDESGLAGPMAIANPLNAAANGQALGHLGGAGFLHDLGGNDVYESYATSEARATASAALPELDAQAEAEANGSTAKSLAQAAGDAEGYGELRDLGGTDEYISINRSLGTADPPTHADGGFTFSTVQGSAELAGTASFADIDGAIYQYDTFTAVPPDPTTVGTRGEGMWVDSVSQTATGPIPSGGTGVNF